MQNPVAWSAALAESELTEAEICVWRASLDCGPDSLRRFEAELTSDEKSRAARFRFARDRNHFIAARGILRELLGAYIHRSPVELEFEYGPRGKPSLRTTGPSSRVRFNLSHSHGLAVYAFALGREVGIDLELIQPDFAGDDIAGRYFSTRELNELRALPPELRPEGFFLCWTRKEAYVKARGEGLQIPLDSFSVSLAPGQRELLESADSSRWSLCSFEPAPRYVAAVVGEGKGWILRHWERKP
jgi:4'-phosphopantetheinyl transferase